MKWKIFSIAVLFASCNLMDDEAGEGKPLPEEMTYSYACLEKPGGDGKMKEILSDADEMLSKATSLIPITDREQNEFGDMFLEEAKKDKNFEINTTDPVNTRLQSIMEKLLAARKDPSSIQYSIYLLTDTANINAFTVGGKIFVNKAIISKCKNDDQLAAIIGHEIGHNERGHIKRTLQKLSATEKVFGESAGMIFQLSKLLTGSFNQKNELEADYYGIDLTWKIGYNICEIEAFWKEMSTGEEHSELEDFFRTHPYSNQRNACLKEHRLTNFKVECP